MRPASKLDTKNAAQSETWGHANFDRQKLTQQACSTSENYKKSASEALAEIIPELFRASASTDTEEFQQNVLPLLQKYIEFDTGWMAISSITDQGPVFRSHQLLGLSTDYIQAWLEVRSLDTVTPRVLNSPGTATVMSRDEVPHGCDFHKFLNVYDIAHAMCVVYVHLSDHSCAHIALYRRNFLPSFSERDQHIIEQISTGFMSGVSKKQIKQASLIDPMQIAALSTLTPKEKEVSQLFAAGLTYKVIANQLGVSPFTIRHHLRSIYSKLGITNKGEMAWLFSKLA